MGVIDEVLSILASSKSILELPTATAIAPADWIIFYNNTSGRAEKVLASNLLKVGKWVFADDALVEKVLPNANNSSIESNDIVWFKDVTFGAVTITLLGWRYDGGDKLLQASYTKVKSIA